MEILGRWKLITADLLDIGIDVDSGILRERSGRWLNDAINGLMLNPQCRIARWRQVYLKQLSEPEEEV